jgi:hypothetical protein
MSILLGMLAVIFGGIVFWAGLSMFRDADLLNSNRVLFPAKGARRASLYVLQSAIGVATFATLLVPGLWLFGLAGVLLWVGGAALSQAGAYEARLRAVTGSIVPHRYRGTLLFIRTVSGAMLIAGLTALTLFAIEIMRTAL